ncbi:NADH-quinone oxidoreductase subunit C [Bacteriovorax sp. DB6_IX]|uniref:NADH-quinone oxidoreductase subunit C n=1 Tax=Bacteriovorax sp. DB6_IX TaxID=1353530 RepID=UPI000389E48D|nr:NADH-quinone oxidoreductase subunit C [Bacteriovorax sp. DB6_IX]EQC50801.1 NADH dehydrogenase, C subunit [Bacteriovorax sp. DB6_IX]
MHKEIVEFLNKEVAGCGASTTEVEVGDASVVVNAESIKPVCFALRDSSEFQFNVLQVVSGVDYEDRIEVHYILASFTKNLELILKVKLPKAGKDEMVKVESVCDVWKSADFQERETYDMLGVEFIGHPDMRRILCPEDWEGFPLRKDYVVQEVYQGMEVNPAHKINQGDFDFMAKAKLDAQNPKLISGSWAGHVSPELSDALKRKMESLEK